MTRSETATPESPHAPEPTPTIKDWVAGARPRTLPSAVVPVVVGAAAAFGPSPHADVIWWRVIAALVVSLLLQIGVNYANDYSDGIKGTDDVRVGPMRLVASGTASPSSVKKAALLSLLLAACIGLGLALDTTLWLLVVGAAAIAAAWFYTGGKNPYGYMGFGELFVFTFFGLVATIGTTYVAIERIPGVAWLAACAVGFPVTGLLVANNLRDIPTDKEVGKKTLAVRIGDQRTRWFYAFLLLGCFPLAAVIAIQRRWALLSILAVIVAIKPVRTVLGGAKGRELIPVLGATGKAQLLFGALLSVGLILR
jgi:1,4-dihydroxy-2-naphthoate polyprenyltransferase